mgnify:CR=1 FL=1
MTDRKIMGRRATTLVAAASRGKPAMHKVPRRRSRFKMRVRSSIHRPAKRKSAPGRSAGSSPIAGADHAGKDIASANTIAAGNDSARPSDNDTPQSPSSSVGIERLPWPPPPPPSAGPCPRPPTTTTHIPNPPLTSTLTLVPPFFPGQLLSPPPAPVNSYAAETRHAHTGILQHAAQNQPTEHAAREEQRPDYTVVERAGPLDKLASVLAALQRPSPAIIPPEEAPLTVILPPPSVVQFRPTSMDRAPRQILDATAGRGTPLSRDRLLPSNNNLIRNSSRRDTRRKFIAPLPIYGTNATVEAAHSSVATLQRNVGILVRGIYVQGGHPQSCFPISLELNGRLDALIWRKVTRQGALSLADKRSVSTGKIRLSDIVRVGTGRNGSEDTRFILQICKSGMVGQNAAVSTPSQTSTLTRDIAFSAGSRDERNRIVVAIHTLLQLRS